jgi:hypothetical protein
MSEYKRQFRELSDETKDKISKSSKGKRKSFSHRQHLSQALQDYWKTVPSNKSIDNNSVKSSNIDE